MHRLSVLFLFLMFALSLGLGSVAHATEIGACVDRAEASSIEHTDGDADQVQGDADRDYPHHHGSCHGHHVGIPFTADAGTPVDRLGMALLTWNPDPMVPVPSDTELRPPQA